MVVCYFWCDFGCGDVGVGEVGYGCLFGQFLVLLEVVWYCGFCVDFVVVDLFVLGVGVVGCVVGVFDCCFLLLVGGFVFVYWL